MKKVTVKQDIKENKFEKTTQKNSKGELIDLQIIWSSVNLGNKREQTQEIKIALLWHC